MNTDDAIEFLDDAIGKISHLRNSNSRSLII